MMLFWRQSWHVLQVQRKTIMACIKSYQDMHIIAKTTQQASSDRNEAAKKKNVMKQKQSYHNQ